MKTKSSVKLDFRFIPLLAAIVAIGCAFASSAFGGSGNWNVDAAGNWSGTANWNPAAVPGTSAGDVVGLNYNITAARTITLDTAATVGTLNLGDPTSSFFGYTLSGGSTLTFNNNGNGANVVQVIVGGANDTLSAPITLADNLTIYNVNGLTNSGVISGSGFGIAKAGTGTLTLNGSAANTYSGPTTVNGGTLLIDFANAVSPASGLINSNSTLYLGGGTLQIKQQSATTTSQAFSNTSLNTNSTTAIIGNQVSSGALTINLGAITNNHAATVDFTVPTGGAIETTAGNVNGVLGGWATTGNNVSSSSTGDWVATSSGNITTYASYTTSGTPSGTTLATANYKGTFTTSASATINSFVETADSTVGSGTTLTIGSGGIIFQGASKWLYAGSATTSFLKSGLSTGELFLHTPNAAATDWRIWPIIEDAPSAPTTLVKDGPGYVGLENYNTYSGGTVVNGGTLAVGGGNNDATPTFDGGGTACMPGPLTINPGATVSLTVVDSLGYTSTALSTTPINVVGGTLDNASSSNQGYLNTFNLTGGTISSSGGGYYNFDGAYSAINSLASPVVSTISGPITLRNGGLIITTAKGTVPSGIDLNISGAIGQNGGTYNLTKAGLGTLELSGGNTFSGGLTLNAGTLTLNNSAALGTGTLTISGGNLDCGTANLTIGNNNAQAWNSDFTFIGSQNLNLGTGAVTPSANRQVTVATNTLTVGGVIGGGAVSLTKAGNGTLTLSGINTYTGGTTVNAGTLNLNNGGSSGCIRGTVTVNSGGILQSSAQDSPGYNGGSGGLTNINLNGGNWNVNTTANQTLGGVAINLTGGSITGNSGGNIDFYTNNPPGSIMSALNTLASSVTSTISGVPVSPLRGGSATFTVAAGTTPSGVDLNISSVLRTSPSGNAAGASLIKAGAGYMLLSAADTYSNNTIISAGTLGFGATGSISNSPNITLSSSGAVFDVSATTFTLRTNQTLAGIGTVNGTVNVASGGIITAGTNNAGTLTLGGLTFNGTGTININPGAAELVVTNVNGLNLAGAANSVTINIGTSPIAADTYTLITYSGSIQGAGFSAFKLGALPPGTTANLVNDTANSSIDLDVTTVSWVGAPTNNWDLLGSNVWVQFGTTVPTSYADGDVTFFGDSASNFAVNVAAKVSPYGVIFSNNANSYSLGGTGGISGQGGLTVEGTGTVTLSTSNSYVGATTISSGKLVMGASNAIPGGVGYGNVAVNGTLDVNGFSPALNNLSGSGVVDNVSAGGLPVLNLSSSPSSTFGGVIQNSSGMLGLTLSGGTLSLAGTNTYTGATTINAGTLQVGAGGTSGALGNTVVLDDSTLAFDRSDSNNVPNTITGTGNVQQNGTGIVNLSGNLTYTGSTLVNAGTLLIPDDVTFDAGVGTTLTIASNAVMQSGFVLSLNANSSSEAVDISGAGTLQLVSTIDRIESFPDLYIGANNNGVSTANLGVRLAAQLNVGSVARLVWAISSEDDVTRYGLTAADCQFAGPISGTAGITLLGKNSWTGVNTMEEQFAFNASNSWTGQLEVQRGSVYVGNSNAFTMGNVLILDPAASVNSRFFLYGFNATVSDLQSGGYGTALVANGNNMTSTNVGPATLTVDETNSTTFAGDIVDWYTEYTAPSLGSFTPTLSLVKNGPAALTLSGDNTYSGTTVINAGALFINGSSTGGGAVTVNTNATLGGDGIINSAVTVKGGGTIETGDGTGNGNLQVAGLTLGSASGNLTTLDLTAAAMLNVTNNNGLVMNGGANSVTVNVGGSIGAVGAVPLITYKGSLGGTGFSAFQLGTLPAGVIGSLSNSTSAATIYLVVSQLTIPRWSGAYSAQWSTNNIPSPKNWVLDSDGVTPLDYLDGESVKFEDTADSTTVSISVANVSPASVTVSNVAKSYTINGAFGVTGPGGLTKDGTGQLTIGTTNSYTGDTTISAGTLTLGAAGAIPGGTGYGNVIVNGTLDVGGFSPTVNNLSGTGIVDNVSVGGSPVLTVDDTDNPTFAGVIKNTTGVLGLAVAGSGTLTLTGVNTYSGPTVVGSGTLTVNGSLAAGGVTVDNGASLGGTGTIGGAVAMSSGTTLNLTTNTPLTVGALALNGSVSVNVIGTVSVTNTANYLLLNHGARSGAGSFLLALVPGITTSGFTATLNDTNNQLFLVIAPTQPTGTIADVRHVVIFIQENRSFDHYFGSLHGVHGFSDHVMLTFTNGYPDIYQPSSGTTNELPFHTTDECLSDLDHSWSPTHEAIDNGHNDGWIAAKGTETMAYYNRSDIPYYYSLADNFTICDEYHCAILTSTDPNRVFLMSGWNDPDDLGGGPLIDNTEPSAGWGTNWVTYPQLLQKAGVSFKVYQASDNFNDNALNWFAAYKDAAVGSPLYNNAETFAPSVQSGTGFGADWTNLVTEFKGAVMSNTLPSVSWIIGPDVGSEHPSWSPEDGEILTKGLLDALASNPKVYNSTVFILNYDENDGFFDHAVPINPPAGTTNEFDSGLPYGLGIRVPCIIISPWSTGGYVSSQVFDHTSVIRFLEKWTGVQEPNISAWRRQVCGDLTTAFDFTHVNTNYPSLLATVENDCASGSSASPPTQQTVPSQESGTLLERPLPYQPNATPVLNCGTGNFYINMTNSGTASVHFSLYPNAYRNDGAWPYDVASSNATASIAFSTTPYSGKYDFSAYGPNGFLRRFGGNINSDCGQIESISYLNPVTGGLEITLANSTASPVVFTVTNGYLTKGITYTNYTVPANTTNVVALITTNNNGWYDLIATASSDPLFIRRFAGHIETNNAVPSSLVSSQNASAYKQNVTFTANLAGYGTPTGTVQFETNGTAFGAPVALANGSASLSTTSLPRGSTLITAAYSGDTLNQPVSLNLTQDVTNHPPVAASVTYTRTAGTELLINISSLLTNVTDVDGNTITLTGVGTDGLNLHSTNGVTLFTNATYILYTNSVTPNVNDSFEYTVNDGLGDTAVATVYITMSNSSIVGQSSPRLTVSATNVIANFFGVPGYTYLVERSTNLSLGEGWVPISTNIAPTNGVFQIIDTFEDLDIPIPPVPSSVFYRLQYNP